MSEADYKFLDENGLSPSEAASVLGISRQAVYAGLSRSTDYFDYKRRLAILESMRAVVDGTHRPRDADPTFHHHIIRFARTLDDLVDDEDFKSLIHSQSTNLSLYCAILAEREAACSVANVLLNSLTDTSKVDQKIPRAIVLRANIAKVTPAISISLDNGVWIPRSREWAANPGINAYCGALMFVLASCGLTFRGREMTPSINTQTEGLDGLKLELILDTGA